MGEDPVIPRGDPALPPGYPAGWESDVVLRDGGTVHVRPIRPGDAGAILALHGRLSPETIYLRFFGPLTTLSPRMLERFVTVDYRDRLALVAVLGDEVVAVGRYERLPSGSGPGDEAEVAFLVDDAQQGRGLGTVLLEQLAAYARAVGVTRFVADTLPENSRMLRMFHEAGFGDERTFADGVVRVAFPIEATPISLTLSHERERLATARSVGRILAPRSVAVVGASRRPETLGNQVLRALLDGGFEGPVFPVNPGTTHVCSVRSYPSVADVPDQVDLAILAVPARAVPEVVEQCVRSHVGGLVVISSGFADRDETGRQAERRLVAEARRNGMRLVGPNSMGVVNTDPNVRLAAAFGPLPPAGQVGFIAQSGALGVVVLDELARRGTGVSSFVSTGNKADVSGNDLLQYWDGDEATRVICMYIETFGNPRTFARVARRVARHKPIVMVKSGWSGSAVDRSTAGGSTAGGDGAGRAEVPADHPGAGEAAVEALLRQTGVIRTATLEELFDVAQVLVSQPLPAGRRVAIVGSSGGPEVLAADACRAAGLEVAALTPAIEERLRATVPAATAAADPVGLPADALPEHLRAALEVVLADDGVDAAIALYTSLLASPADAVATAVATAATTAPEKPVVASILGRRGLVGPEGRRVPSFAFPEAAARALGRVAEYAEWRRRPVGTLPDLPVDTVSARELVSRALEAMSRSGEGGNVARTGGEGVDVDDGRGGAGETDVAAGEGEQLAGEGEQLAGGEPRAPQCLRGGWLDRETTRALAAAYGIDLLPSRPLAADLDSDTAAGGVAGTASDPRRLGDAAVAAAGQLGYPVVVEVDPGPSRTKAERGNIRLGLLEAGAVRVAVAELASRGPMVVQATARPGWDVAVGVTQDPDFGPLVSLGTGGRLGEPVRVRRSRILPVTDVDAAELRTEVLGSHRPDGSPWSEAEKEAIDGLVLRVGRLVEDLPEVTHLDLDPVVVSPGRAAVAGLRVHVQPPEPHPERALRRLR